jgi:UDP-N-acetylglucosamine 4,6-dehydratase
MNSSLFSNKTILITGGTGSFGKHFTKYLLEKTDIKKVIIYSRDEFKQFTMQQELKNYTPRIRFFIGDIKDKERLLTAFNGVDYVIHAAAMKHVPICEYNPFEAVKSNITGTQNVADAAIQKGVQKLIGISTDKAVSPINLYGATKLAADKLLVASNAYVGAHNKAISVIRFGNFAGSRGSIIPFFHNLIQNKVKALPITDPQMTRYWISLNEACETVIEALSQAQGGEIFVPKLPSFRITDLANAMAPEIPLEIIGLREGERLHEALIGEYDSFYSYEKENYYVIYPHTEWKNPSHFSNKGTLVKPHFEYNSLNNTCWLSVKDIKERLKKDVSFLFES